MLFEEDGYTLLELLVALAIIAMMAPIIAFSLQMGIAVWKTTNGDITQYERDFLTRQRLGDWLRSAYPYDPNRKEGVVSYPFTGSEAALSFVAPIYPDPMYDTKYKLSLELKEKDLELTFWPDHINGDVSFAQKSQTLTSGIKSLKFAYLDDITDPFYPIWVTTWQDRFSPPSAVRIQIEFEDPKRSWPDMVTRLEVREWQYCAFDEVSRTCRTGTRIE